MDLLKVSLVIMTRFAVALLSKIRHLMMSRHDII